MRILYENFILIKREPTTEEYILLHRSAGWWYLETEAIEMGLCNSFYSICIYNEESIVGCGRVIGENGMYFYIQDEIFLTEYQGMGIGTLIMNTIMEKLKKSAKSGAFIGLMAATGVTKYYLKFGFIERPKNAPGMYQVY